MKEDDNNWPEPDKVGCQELEIVMGNEHISFTTSKIGSLLDVQSSKDPEGLRIFYYLVQVSILHVFLKYDVCVSDCFHVYLTYVDMYRYFLIFFVCLYVQNYVYMHTDIQIVFTLWVTTYEDLHFHS
jgi:hypothetical protein